MVNNDRIKIVTALVLIGLLTVFCANFWETGSSQSKITALLTEVSGKVQLMEASKGVFEAASVNFDLEVNDQLLTGEDGRARIDISDDTIIRLSPLSNFVLSSMEDTDQGTLTRLQLKIGQLWIILQGGVLEVDTPFGLASVQGSYMHVWVDPLNEETRITCLEGVCALSNDEGTVSLVGGQTAVIRGLGNAPEAGKMTDQDVRDWLETNPEATLVIIPLTQTVAANQDHPTPAAKTNTPAPTNTLGPSPTAEPTSTPTQTLIAVDCGPPVDWVLHTVRAGETLESLSLLYRVSEAALRLANCRGDLDFVVPGETFYVPNVATSTPTFTPTPTLTPTPLPSKTPAPTTGSGTEDSPTEMSGPVGPDNLVINSTSLCPNPYKIKVIDADGLEDVKMIYTFDGSLPMRDKAISEGKYKLLPLITDDVYGVSGYIIETTGESLPVKIRFRFAANDKNGIVTYFPKDDAYDLTDEVNCSVNTPTSFSNESGPDGETITDINTCQQTFQVDVVDPDGISWVKLVYSTDGSVPVYDTHSNYLMSKNSGDTYKVTEVVDTSGTPTTVKYVYAVMDGKGALTHFPETGAFSYTDTIECGVTSWANPVAPTGNLTSCDNDYGIDVSDANGISKVELYYTIQDSGTLADKSDSFILPLISGDSIEGIYLLNTSIDINSFGYSAGSMILWEFKALDTRGILTLMSTGSYIDDFPCVP